MKFLFSTTESTKTFRGIIIPEYESLARQFGDGCKDLFEGDQSKISAIVISQPHPGAVWISILKGTWGTRNNKIYSLYYHPTKEHTATTTGRLGQKRSYAAANKWAVSIQTKGMWGNKTNYNTLD